MPILKKWFFGFFTRTHCHPPLLQPNTATTHPSRPPTHTMAFLRAVARRRNPLLAAGVLLAGSSTAAYLHLAPDALPPVDGALQPGRSLTCRLASAERVSHNTTRYRFALPTPEHVLGMPVASHLLAVDTSMMVSRPYTPVTLDGVAGERGHFDLLVKRYPGGYFSDRVFGKLRVGDAMEFRGPVATLGYAPNAAGRLGMIAGGTGITPLYQIIRTVLLNAEDRTRLSLLYANRTEADILLRGELEALAAAHPDRFEVRFLVTGSGSDSDSDSGSGSGSGSGRGVDSSAGDSGGGEGGGGGRCGSGVRVGGSDSSKDGKASTNGAAAADSPPNTTAALPPQSTATATASAVSTATVATTTTNVTAVPATATAAAAATATITATSATAAASSASSSAVEVVGGRLSRDMVEGFLPAPSEDRSAVLVCGPDGLLQHLCGKGHRDGGAEEGRPPPPLGGLLKRLGYMDGRVVRF